MKIVIDPGHAGRDIDPGAVNKISGLQEADITFMISKLLENCLLEDGYEVKLTRNDWEEEETDDLSYRTALANSWGADIFISLHCNSAENENAKGYEIWTSPGDTLGDRLANCIYGEISVEFPDEANMESISMEELVDSVIRQSDTVALEQAEKLEISCASLKM